MKIKYTTTRETACVLKEMAGNLNASFRSMRGMCSVVDRLSAQRARPVEDFMTGEVVANEATPEAVLRAFQNCRTFRAKTILKLAPTIQILS